MKLTTISYYFGMPLGTIPAATAPVPAPAAGATLFFFLNSLFARLITGIVEYLANHGVAHKLSISRNGNSTLVIA